MNNCGHKYECGCDKVFCADCAIKNETDDLDWCDDETCKHYYAYRNDNCTCRDNGCGYCNPDEEDDDYDEDNLCYHCGCYLDENTHIFIFEKNGQDDMTMCADCGEHLADQLREEGWKRDDDEDDVQR